MKGARAESPSCQPLNQLKEAEKNQLSDTQKKDSKLSVLFSSATLNDCVRTDGLGLDLRFIEPISIPVPSKFFRWTNNDPIYTWLNLILDNWKLKLWSISYIKISQFQVFEFIMYISRYK